MQISACQVASVLPLVILMNALGVSGQLSLELEQNHSFPFTCNGTVVRYTCKSSDFIRWSVVPENGTDFPLIRVVDNSLASIGTTNITDNVIVQVVTVQPVIITYLTIVSEGFFNRAMVSCSSFSDPTLSDSLMFDSGAGLPDPPSDLTCSKLPADFKQGAFTIDFTPSRNVDFYVATCAESDCEGTTISSEQSSVTLKASARISSTCYTVQLCAVNFCGTESRQEEIEVCISTIEAYSAVVFAYPFTVTILATLLVIFVLLTLYYYYRLKNIQTAIPKTHEELQLKAKQ